MNRQDHLLWNVAEECAEVAQRASKAARFSLQEIQPGQELTNAQRLVQEYADLVAVMQMLEEEGGIEIPENFQTMVTAKKSRFDKFLGRSKACGTLD